MDDHTSVHIAGYHRGHDAIEGHDHRVHPSTGEEPQEQRAGSELPGDGDPGPPQVIGENGHPLDRRCWPQP